VSKKDYQAIARAIHEAREAHAERSAWESEVKEVLADVAERLADVFKADNHMFDRGRFIEACETGKCKGMKK
jgi:hypothetical protein